MHYIRARFDKKGEQIEHPLIAHAHLMKTTQKDRIIEFKSLLSKEEIKEKIKEHFKKYNGELAYFGKIKYYEFYHSNKLLYKFNVNADLIYNYELIRLMTKFCSTNLEEDLEYIFKYGETYLELFVLLKNSFAKYNFCNNCEEDIRKVIKKLLNKELYQTKIFHIIRKLLGNVKEDYKKYEDIANKIDKFYKQQSLLDEWHLKD